MRSLLQLTRLKLIELVNQPLLLAMLLVLPVALGSISGSANIQNNRIDIDLAVVDLDQSRTSRRFSGQLAERGWTIHLVDAAAAERLLNREQVDGVLTIEEGFGETEDYFQNPRLVYQEMQGSVMTTLIQEAIRGLMLPLASQENLIRQVVRFYESAGQPVPADLAERFAAQVDEYLQQNDLITITYIGQLNVQPALTMVVSDYSAEVFFLSFYAILGSLALSKARMRQRLRATAHGLLLDYVSTLSGLVAFGLLQILAYTLAMNLVMRQPIALREMALLVLFLFFILGFGQLLALIEESLRLYLSLLLLLASAIMGGSFFEVSYRMLYRVGRFTPHGWVLGAIRGADVWPAWLVALFSLGLLILGYRTQLRRSKQAQ